MRAMQLPVFVMSLLPAPAALQASACMGAAEGGAGASSEANERGRSELSGADTTDGDEGSTAASCVVSCPNGDKDLSCPGGHGCICYCDPGGDPVCKCT